MHEKREKTKLKRCRVNVFSTCIHLCYVYFLEFETLREIVFRVCEQVRTCSWFFCYAEEAALKSNKIVCSL